MPPCDATASGRLPSPSVSSSPGTSCSEWARAGEVKARSRQAAVTRWGARRRRRSTSPVSPIPFRWWREGICRLAEQGSRRRRRPREKPSRAAGDDDDQGRRGTALRHPEGTRPQPRQASAPYRAPVDGRSQVPSRGGARRSAPSRLVALWATPTARSIGSIWCSCSRSTRRAPPPLSSGRPASTRCTRLFLRLYFQRPHRPQMVHTVMSAASEEIADHKIARLIGYRFFIFEVYQGHFAAYVFCRCVVRILVTENGLTRGGGVLFWPTSFRSATSQAPAVVFFA